MKRTLTPRLQAATVTLTTVRDVTDVTITMTTTIITAVALVVSTTHGSSATMVTRLITAIRVGIGIGTSHSTTAMALVGVAIIHTGITTGLIPTTAMVGVHPIIMVATTVRTMAITGLITDGAPIIHQAITPIAVVQRAHATMAR